MIEISDEHLKILKDNLKQDEKRIHHVISVSKIAQELCAGYNIKDEKTLYNIHIAALFHDVCKRYKESDYINLLGEKLYRKYKKSPNLHGIAGAYFVKNILKINNKDIFNAIFYHTTGYKKFKTFEKIIYISDKIDYTREKEEIKLFRKVAFFNIDYAILMHYNSLKKLLKEKNIKPDKNATGFIKKITKGIIKIGIWKYIKAFRRY